MEAASLPLVVRATASGQYVPPNGPVDELAITFIILTWITMFLRLWTRGRIINSLGTDEITMLITMVSPS